MLVLKMVGRIGVVECGRCIVGEGHMLLLGGLHLGLDIRLLKSEQSPLGEAHGRWKVLLGGMMGVGESFWIVSSRCDVPLFIDIGRVQCVNNNCSLVVFVRYNCS